MIEIGFDNKKRKSSKFANAVKEKIIKKNKYFIVGS
jgi:hypothetical protein